MYENLIIFHQTFVPSPIYFILFLIIMHKCTQNSCCQLQNLLFTRNILYFGMRMSCSGPPSPLLCLCQMQISNFFSLWYIQSLITVSGDGPTKLWTPNGIILNSCSRFTMQFGLMPWYSNVLLWYQFLICYDLSRSRGIMLASKFL